MTTTTKTAGLDEALRDVLWNMGYGVTMRAAAAEAAQRHGVDAEELVATIYRAFEEDAARANREDAARAARAAASV